MSRAQDGGLKRGGGGVTTCVMDPVTAYAGAVVDGRVPAGTWVVRASQRHLDDLTAASARGWRWDPDAVTAIGSFAQLCRQFKGRQWAGQPLVLEGWETFILGSLLGWKLASSGLRRYRQAFVELPRGNGKSTIAAVLALYLTFLDGESGAESYAIATKKDQARIVWRTAREMVVRSRALKTLIEATAHRLIDPTAQSVFEPLGADVDGLDGLRPHVVIADEVHAVRDALLLTLFETGMGTRLQPLMFEITTAGLRRDGPWWAHREYSRHVLDGSAVEGGLEDPTWFAYVACAEDGDDWTAPATWRKANPNYGVSVSAEHLAVQCAKAQRMPMFEADFRRLHCGQLVEGAERTIPVTQWAACRHGLAWADYAGRRCWGGLDLASTTDLAALVLVFDTLGPAGQVVEGWCDCFAWFWVPAYTVDERATQDKQPYGDWVRQGWIKATKGRTTDYGQIRADVVALSRVVQIAALGYDPWNASYLADELRDQDGVKMVEVRQTFPVLTQPTKRLIGMVAEGQIRHGGQGVLTSHIEHFQVARDASGNMRPDKGKAIERIDGAVALIMAIDQWERRPSVPAVVQRASQGLSPLRILGG